MYALIVAGVLTFTLSVISGIGRAYAASGVRRHPAFGSVTPVANALRIARATLRR
ncbi:MAG: hypothetical protein ACYDA1_06180 [Vulcanimicrobiaceae bacterium]